ncbi:MFS transporter [Corynebacterium variabile]|uniref:Major Facilitator Superfamily n=2 Tax=Corynebacterium variabile TaxID=1727 RepID=A0A0X2NNI3_9CORY|nr:MFS transporter [Corynebacterium variabile]CUU67052.1 Major Facilitator Superfamily [Corynebacterium variabile]
MSPVTPSPVPDQPLQPPRENIPSPITLALGTGIMLQALNSSMIAVAMVSIGSHFGAGAEVSWVLSAFYIATAIVSPMAGVLGVVFGARRVYLAGLFLVLLGSVLGALAPSLGVLVAGRLIIGVGVATQMPNAMTIVRVLARRNRWRTGSAISVFTVCGQAMSAVGPSLGGLLVGVAGWQSTLWINVMLVAVSGAWVIVKVPRIAGEGRPEMGLGRRLDIVGALLFGMTVTMLMLFLISLTDEISWWTLPLLVLFGGVWVWWELQRASLPFIDLRAVAANRQLANTLGRTMVTYAAFYCLYYGLPQWFEQGAGMSVSQAGAMMFPMAVVSVGSTFVAARVIAVRGPRVVLGIGGIFLLLTGLALALVEDSSTPVWMMVIVALIAGVPNGFNNIGNQELINTVTSVEKVGTATGIYKTSQYVAANLSAVIVALCMSVGAGDGSAGATDAGLHFTGWAIAALGAVMTLGIVFARKMPVKVRA